MSKISSFDATGLAHRWADGWSAKDPSLWMACYTPQARYIDHAFQIIRVGTTTTLPSHWQIWRTAIPDFVMTITAVYPPVQLENGKVKVIFRTDNKGTLVNDLPRTKATGKPFLFRGVVEVVVDEASGLIEELEEWYSFNFKDAESLEDYHFKGDPEEPRL